MKKGLILFVSLLLVFSSCDPRVTTQLYKRYPPLNPQDNVIILGLSDLIPDDAEILGELKIGDTGFSVDCNYEIVIMLAKTEARKVGGNAIKITYHAFPDFVSTCHRIQAKILKINESDIMYTK
jgi:hypothetical protein